MEETGKPTCITRSAQARKASGAFINYEIGHDGKQAFIRVVKNEGSGTFSKEWVPFTAVAALASSKILDGKPLAKSDLMEVFKGRSKNNPHFLAGVLRTEGLAADAPDLPGKLVVTGDWDGWQSKVVATVGTPIVEEEKAKASSVAAAKAKAAEPGAQKLAVLEAANTGDSEATSSEVPSEGAPEAKPAEAAEKAGGKRKRKTQAESTPPPEAADQAGQTTV